MKNKKPLRFTAPLSHSGLAHVFFFWFLLCYPRHSFQTNTPLPSPSNQNETVRSPKAIALRLPTCNRQCVVSLFSFRANLSRHEPEVRNQANWRNVKQAEACWGQRRSKRCVTQAWRLYVSYYWSKYVHPTLSPRLTPLRHPGSPLLTPGSPSLTQAQGGDAHPLDRDQHVGTSCVLPNRCTVVCKRVGVFFLAFFEKKIPKTRTTRNVNSDNVNISSYKP